MLDACTLNSSSSSSNSDVELLAGLLAKHAAAWRTFEKTLRPVIARCLNKVLGRFASSVSEADVRDVESTVLLSLVANDMHKLRSWDPARGTSLASWVGHIAVLAAYDHLRTVRRTPKSAPIEDALHLEAVTECPVERKKAEEEHATVKSLLGTLSERDQSFCTLYFAEELAPESIAQQLGISVNTVYSKKYKSRRVLARSPRQCRWPPNPRRVASYLVRVKLAACGKRRFKSPKQRLFRSRSRRRYAPAFRPNRARSDVGVKTTRLSQPRESTWRLCPLSSFRPPF